MADNLLRNNDTLIRGATKRIVNQVNPPFRNLMWWNKSQDENGNWVNGVKGVPVLTLNGIDNFISTPFYINNNFGISIKFKINTINTSRSYRCVYGRYDVTHGHFYCTINTANKVMRIAFGNNGLSINVEEGDIIEFSLINKILTIKMTTYDWSTSTVLTHPSVFLIGTLSKNNSDITLYNTILYQNIDIIAEYNFTGNTHDSSGNGNDAAVGGTLDGIWDYRRILEYQEDTTNLQNIDCVRAKLVDSNCVTFNGINNGLNAGITSYLCNTNNAWTMRFKFRFKSFLTTNPLFNNGSSGADGIFVWFTSYSFNFHVRKTATTNEITGYCSLVAELNYVYDIELSYDGSKQNTGFRIKINNEAKIINLGTNNLTSDTLDCGVSGIYTSFFNYTYIQYLSNLDAIYYVLSDSNNNKLIEVDFTYCTDNKVYDQVTGEQFTISGDPVTIEKQDVLHSPLTKGFTKAGTEMIPPLASNPSVDCVSLLPLTNPYVSKAHNFAPSRVQFNAVNMPALNWHPNDVSDYVKRKEYKDANNMVRAVEPIVYSDIVEFTTQEESQMLKFKQI